MFSLIPDSPFLSAEIKFLASMISNRIWFAICFSLSLILLLWLFVLVVVTSHS